jgi:hypothetical protein
MCSDTEGKCAGVRVFCAIISQFRIPKLEFRKGKQVGSSQIKLQVGKSGLFQPGGGDRVAQARLFEPAKAAVFEPPGASSVIVVAQVGNVQAGIIHILAGIFGRPAAFHVREHIGRVLSHPGKRYNAHPGRPVITSVHSTTIGHDPHVGHTLEKDRDVKLFVARRKPESVGPFRERTICSGIASHYH